MIRRFCRNRLKKFKVMDQCELYEQNDKGTIAMEESYNSKKSSSVKTLLSNLGLESNVHGISRLVSNRPLYLKFLWLIAFLGLAGFGLYQVSSIFLNFLQYPVKTTVRVRFNPLPFPSVTVCNMNIIKRSEADRIKNKKLKQILNGTYVPPISNTTNTTSNSLRGILDTDPNITDPLGLHDSLDPASDWMTNHNNFYNSEGPIEPVVLDKKSMIQQKFVDEYQKLSRKNRSELGHQIENMLIDCTFSGTKCDSPAKKIVTYEYGNCYTLQSPRYFSASSGPQGGMTLTINLENHEAFEEMTEGFGLRLVIHEVGSFPLPVEKGMTISGGVATSISLKLTKIKRMNSPYGKCEDPLDYFKKNQVRYTIQGCILNCWESLVLSSCGCKVGYLKTELGFFTDHDNSTEYTVNTGGCITYTDKVCYLYLRRDFLRRTSEYCYCPPPCFENVYSASSSGAIWPHRKKLAELKNLSCETYNVSATGEIATCGLDSLNISELSSNFLKIHIYFEELNYEEVIEEPLYDVNQIIADVGGSLGLCLGFSLLCICELIEAIAEVILTMIRRICKTNRINGAN